MSNFQKIKGKDQIILYPSDTFDETYQTLKPGVYKSYDAGGFMTTIPGFEPVKQGDKLVQFTSGLVSTVIDQVQKFFSEESKKAYEELKITHKMGLLFYGKQGTGKTCTCILIMKSLVEKYNAICLDCTGLRISFIKFVIRRLRDFQPNPIVIFVDECESAIDRDEHEYLTFLDGGDSVGNLVFMGCTNYFHRIPDRISKRKSRIKHLHNINSLPEGVYKEYLKDRLPNMDSKLVNEFTYHAMDKSLTIDQFKHAIIDYKIERIPIKKAIELAATFEE